MNIPQISKNGLLEKRWGYFFIFVNQKTPRNIIIFYSDAIRNPTKRDWGFGIALISVFAKMTLVQQIFEMTLSVKKCFFARVVTPRKSAFSQDRVAGLTSYSETCLQPSLTGLFSRIGILRKNQHKCCMTRMSIVVRIKQTGKRQSVWEWLEASQKLYLQYTNEWMHGVSICILWSDVECIQIDRSHQRNVVRRCIFLACLHGNN